MPGRSFAIEDEVGRHIGNVMYYNIDTARSEAEIGISIGERGCWSLGYGSDALEAVVRGLFEVCGTSWRDGHTFIIMEVRREWVLDTALAEPERRREAVA
jgi:hypothetical protein